MISLSTSEIKKTLLHTTKIFSVTICTHKRDQQVEKLKYQFVQLDFLNLRMMMAQSMRLYHFILDYWMNTDNKLEI